MAPPSTTLPVPVSDPAQKIEGEERLTKRVGTVVGACNYGPLRSFKLPGAPAPIKKSAASTMAKKQQVSGPAAPAVCPVDLGYTDAQRRALGFFMTAPRTPPPPARRVEEGLSFAALTSATAERSAVAHSYVGVIPRIVITPPREEKIPRRLLRKELTPVQAAILARARHYLRLLNLGRWIDMIPYPTGCSGPITRPEALAKARARRAQAAREARRRRKLVALARARAEFHRCFASGENLLLGSTGIVVPRGVALAAYAFQHTRDPKSKPQPPKPCTTPRRAKAPRRVIVDPPSQLRSEWPIQVHSLPERSGYLLNALRVLIGLLRSRRCGDRIDVWAEYRFTQKALQSARSRTVARAEMPTTDPEATTPVCQQEETTVLSEAVPPSLACPIPLGRRFTDMAAPASKNQYPELVGRWIPLKLDGCEWKTTDEKGKTLQELRLPHDALNGVAKSNPAMLPFLVHRYCCGDFEVKCQINSNQYQIGSLQMSWYYGADYDGDVDSRKNLYSGSQMPHVLIDAGISNTGELCIPYKAHAPWIPIDGRTDLAENGYFGTLYLRVMNPLSVPSTVYKSCSYTLFIRFKDFQFAGLTSQALMRPEPPTPPAAPEMWAMTAAMAMQQLNQSAADANRDRPPYQGGTVAMVPQSSQSFSIGRNLVEPLTALRLDARGQTPQPLGDNSLRVSDIVKVAGYVGTVSWQTSASAGDLLASFPAAPLWPLDKWYRPVKKDKVETHILPPVTVLSLMHANWRGSLEVRIDAVCSKFHVGRFMLIYVPGALSDTKMTLAMAQGSPYVTYDLSGSTQSYRFTIPYIADKPWWPRAASNARKDDEYLPPGYVYLYVINPLIPMDSVSPTVYLNFYLSGTDETEFSVPCQPSIVLARDATPPTPTPVANDVFAQGGYYPWYLGTWHSVGGNIAVARYGQYSDQAARFDNLKKGFYYKFRSDKYAKALKFQDHDNRWVSGAACYFVGTSVGDGIYYLVAASSSERARSIWWHKDDAGKWKERAKPDYTTAYTLGTTAGNSYYSNMTVNAILYGTEYDFGSDNPDIAWPEMPEREEQDALECAPQQSASTTSGGSLTFGESFMDLKDMLRRYVPYWNYETSVVRTGLERALFLLPITPVGLDLNPVDQMSMQSRDSWTSIVLSGYRYCRGSMNIRFIMDSTKFGIWVQHRPDRRVNLLRPEISSDSAEMYLQQGYAMAYQAAHINNQFTVNVPYYQPGILGFLQVPRRATIQADLQYTLGQLAVGLHGVDVDSSEHATPVRLHIFSSVGDDFRPHTFVGFPPVIFRSALARFTADAEMPLTVRFKHDVSAKLMSTFTGQLASAVAKSYKNSKTVKTAAKSFGALLVNNVVLAAVGGETKNWVASVMMTLVTTGLVAATSVADLVTAFSSRLERMLGTSEHQTVPSARAEAPSEEDIESWVTPVTLLFTAITSHLGIASKDKKSIKSWASGMTKGLTMSAGRVHGLTTFFRNLITTLVSMWNWCLMRCVPEYGAQIRAERMVPLMELWYKEFEDVMDPKMQQKLSWAPGAFERLRVLNSVGARISERLRSGELSVPSNLVTSFEHARQRIRQLYLEVEKRQVSACTREEPFVIYCYGAKGIGKSHMMSAIVTDLLVATGESIEGKPIYTHPPGAKHWNGCTSNELVHYFDDYGQVETTQEMDDHCVLMALKSSAVLIPPQAAIDDKAKPFAPRIVFANANVGWPKPTTVTDISALHRRRDEVRRVYLDPKFEIDGKSIYVEASRGKQELSISDVRMDDPLVINAMRHLQPYLFEARHPLDPEWKGVTLNYEQFMKYLIPKYQHYRKKERQLYLERKGAIDRLIKNEQVLTLDDTIVREQERIQAQLLEKYQATPMHRAYRAVISAYKKAVGKANIFAKKADACLSHAVSEVSIDSDDPIAEARAMMDRVSGFGESTGWLKGGDVTIPAPRKFVEVNEAEFSDMGMEADSDLLSQMRKHCASAADARFGLAPGCAGDFDDDDIELEDIGENNIFINAGAEGPVFDHSSAVGFIQSVIQLDPVNSRPWPSWLVSAVVAAYGYQDEPSTQFSEVCRVINTCVQKCTHCASDFTIVFVPVRNENLICCADSGIVFPLEPCSGGQCIFGTMAAGLKRKNGRPFNFELLFRASREQSWDFIYKRVDEGKYDSGGVNPTVLYKQQSHIKNWREILTKKLTIKKVTLKKVGRSILRWVTFALKWFVIIIAPVSCLVALLWAIYARKYKSDPLSDIADPYHGDVEAGYGGDISRRPGPSRTGIRPRGFGASEAPHNPNAEGIYNLVRRNIRFIEISGVERSTGRPYHGSCRALGIYGRQLLILNHYLVKARSLVLEGEQAALFNLVGETKQRIDLLDCPVKRMPESEFCLLTLPAQCNLFRDIRKHFATHHVVSSRLPSSVTMMEMTPQGSASFFPLHMRVCEAFTLQVEGGPEVHIPNVFQYNWHGYGRCMSVLFENVDTKIVGFHVGGRAGCGYAEPIMFEDFPTTVAPTPASDIAEYVSVDAEPRVELSGVLTPVAVVEAPFAHQETGKSAIIPSVIHGVFPVRTKPGILKPVKDPATGQMLSPMVLGCEKHGQPPLDFPRFQIDRMEQLLTEMMFANIPAPFADRPTVRSLHFALNGTPGEVGLKAIELNTSEGFPYTGMRPSGACNKKWLIIREEKPNGDPTYKLHKRLKAIMAEKEELRRSGQVPTTVFVDCLKDARLPLEKCVPGKTRIFSISPTDFTIQYRQYFGDWLVGFMKAGSDMCHAVGIASNKYDWTVLARDLTRKGTRVLCGDYSNFGPGFSADVHAAVGRAQLAWYRLHGACEEDQRVREIMQEELVNAVHLCFNILYRTHSGMPSGSPATTPTNCLVNLVYMWLAWSSLMVKTKYHAMHTFWQHVVIRVYGDDVIMNVSDEVSEYFNNETLSAFFASYNIKYTDATKTGTIRKWTTINEATFLKCRFLPHPERPGIVTAGLDKASIEDCANWIVKCADHEAASRENTCQTLMSAFGWGREYFEYVRGKLLCAWVDRGLQVGQPKIYLATWDEVDRMHFGDLDSVCTVLGTGQAASRPALFPPPSEIAGEEVYGEGPFRRLLKNCKLL